MATPKEYKIAFIDIETAPSLGWVWGKYEQNVLDFTKEWYMLSFSVKWQGRKKPEVYALPDFPLYAKDREDDKMLVRKLWEVLNEADLVVAHNGDKFDLRKANARFIYHGMTSPSPYQTVDTLKLARKYFNFTSNKLNDIVKYFGLGEKVRTGGFDLWRDCLFGNPAAWKRMKRYNAHDVVLLEKVYNRFRGWHKLHPNVNINHPTKRFKCPNCASSRVQRRGWYNMKAFRAQKYACLNCGAWPKGPREKLAFPLLT